MRGPGWGVGGGCGIAPTISVVQPLWARMFEEQIKLKADSP